MGPKKKRCMERCCVFCQEPNPIRNRFQRPEKIGNSVEARAVTATKPSEVRAIGVWRSTQASVWHNTARVFCVKITRSSTTEVTRGTQHLFKSEDANRCGKYYATDIRFKPVWPIGLWFYVLTVGDKARLNSCRRTKRL